jgi:hypothetical protein
LLVAAPRQVRRVRADPDAADERQVPVRRQRAAILIASHGRDSCLERRRIDGLAPDPSRPKRRISSMIRSALQQACGWGDARFPMNSGNSSDRFNA